MRKKIKIIANPISGGDARPHISQAVRCLEEAGAEVELYLTGARGDASAEASRLLTEDFDLVIAAGGDGTLNEVANGLVGRGIPLAFVPLGTANVMALEMGIPFEIKGACQIALAGTAKPVSLAEINGNLFLMMAGIGYDAAAVRAVNPRLKKHTGKFAYFVAGLQAFFTHRPKPLQLENAEGGSLTIYHAIISNIRYYGGRFVMAPDASLEKTGLTASVIDKPGRFALLLFYLRIILRGTVLGPVKRIESSSFKVSGPLAPVQIDGDDYGDTPLEISSRTNCLELVFSSE